MYTVENNQMINTFMGFDDMNLNYHTDLSKLNLVVDKIKSLGFWVETTDKYIKHCRIGQLKPVNLIVSISLHDKIEVIYTACIEFIKWYNKNALSDINKIIEYNQTFHFHDDFDDDNDMKTIDESEIDDYLKWY